MLIDTHAHLSLDDDITSFMSKAIENNVQKIILGGTCTKENEESLKILRNNENIYMTIGIHPEFCESVTENDFDILIKSIDTVKKIVGIGEIGLDYHYGKENRKKQIELFKKQLEIARIKKLPVVIHTRDAMNETYEILKESGCRGVIHCFSGSFEMAKKFIDIGFLLGIGGVVTFKNSNLKSVIEKIDLKNIVLETDSPYLSPFRGEKNESSNIKYICQYIADIKGVSFEEVEKITTINAEGLFDL